MLFIAALPFAFLYEGGFIGQLFGTELAFLVIVPFLWATGTKSPSPEHKKVFQWFGILLIVAIATDIYRGIFLGDLLRGWAKIIFFAMDIFVLAQLLNTERKVFLWGVGWNIAFAIHAWKEFDDFAISWKFGIGKCAVAALACALLFLWPKKRTAISFVVAATALADAGYSLFANARSTFLEMSFAALLLILTATPRLRAGVYKIWQSQGLLTLIVAISLPYVAGLIYSEGAQSGFFGEEARQKFILQRSDASDPVLAILAGGRSEFYSSTAAIADSPIIGYGSWARSAYYYNIFAEKLHEHGTPDQIREIEQTVVFGEPLIPSHSTLLGAWVEAGIVGAIFWLVLLRVALRAVKSAFLSDAGVGIPVLILFPICAWDFLFSPFAGDMRLFNAISLCVFLFAIMKFQSDAASAALPAQAGTARFLPK